MQVLEQSRRNLLLIDDDHDLRELIKSILQAEGYNVQTAKNGEEGLLKLQDSVPSMVLVDFMMPVMNGEEFVRALKKHPTFCQIPVVMISASATLSNAVQAHRLLAKPFDLDEMLAMISHYTQSCCDVVISET